MTQAEIIDLLKAHDLKITDKRLQIIDFFRAADGYRTAKTLNNYMRRIYPSISFDTVYRNLHLYHNLNVLESTTLNGEKHFRLRCFRSHHHHFICGACGTTRAIDCPMENVSSVLSDYTILDHKFEIYGLCPDCHTA